MTPLDTLPTLADSMNSAMIPTLGLAAWQFGLLTVFFTFVCVVMILTVLIQRAQGGGLSGAFGSGAGSGQTAFGARTGDALTWATIIMFVIFIVTAVALNFAARPSPAPANPAGTAGPEGAAVVEDVPPAEQPDGPAMVIEDESETPEAATETPDAEDPSAESTNEDNDE